MKSPMQNLTRFVILISGLWLAILLFLAGLRMIF
jgi:preprotein translocase subunit SecG